ncbi:glycerophosphodiester phosphodiesterase [Brachybacterium sp. GCM10030267]|uniref:glycerophosphodiester phosphodiesterase n=1 Tax=Brachybacterium sp. GCM10030267 TaxID=3273381 RepID=UPI00360E7D32
MAHRAPLIVGHRGAADVAPENTLAAFRRGLADGADMLECDVHLSSDGLDAVIHDATVDRTAQRDAPLRTGAVAELTRSRLDQVLVGEDEHIPTLSAVLDVAGSPPRGPGAPAPVLVEIKAIAAARRVAAILLDRFGDDAWDRPVPPARIISFHPEALRTAHERAPAVPRGYLARELSESVLEEAAQLEAATLAVRASQLRAGDADRIRACGIVPTLWGTRTDEEVALALDLGAPWIGADDPARIRRVVENQLGR